MRNLGEVVDKIIEAAPDLRPVLSGARSSIAFAPPENLGMWWHEVAMLLNDHALEHPKREEIRRIFAGEG